MGEDSEHTFAGQYKSLLNAPQQDLLQGYKEVLAGAYSPSAMEYRRQKGIAEHEVVMAVAYQCMIEARASGVLYTLDPVDPTHEVMVISSTWGIGAPIVNGSGPADRFLVRRQSPHQIQSLDIVRKSRRLVVRPVGGCEFEPVEEKMQTGVSLSKEQIYKLAEVAMLIERYFKCPQDIEWAFDQQGRSVHSPGQGAQYQIRHRSGSLRHRHGQGQLSHSVFRQGQHRSKRYRIRQGPSGTKK